MEAMAHLVNDLLHDMNMVGFPWFSASQASLKIASGVLILRSWEVKLAAKIKQKLTLLMEVGQTFGALVTLGWLANISWYRIRQAFIDDPFHVKFINVWKRS